MNSARKKAEKQIAREQEKRLKKHKKPKLNNQILGLKSIGEMQKDGIGTMIREQLTTAWYFDTWYQKVILLIMFVLGIWKLFG